MGLAYPSSSGAAFLDETFLAHLGRMAKSEATRMGVAVGSPILAKGMRAAQLSERTHAEVSRLVREARALSGP